MNNNNNYIIGRGVFPNSMLYSSVLFEVMSKQGMCLDAFLQGTNVLPDELIRHDAYIGNVSADRLSLNALEFCDDEIELAWTYAQALAFTSHGYLGLAVQSASSVRDVIDIITTYFPSRTPALRLTVIEESDRIGLQLQHLLANEAFDLDYESKQRVTQFGHLLILFTINVFGRSKVLSSQLSDEQRVMLEQATTDMYLNFNRTDMKECHDYPQIRLVFDPVHNNASKILWPSAILDFPIAGTNEYFSAAAIKQCEESLSDVNQLMDAAKNNIIHRVSYLLNNEFHQLPNLDTTADHLHMSPRTLKRHLKQAGTSFLEIKNNVRYQHALDLLMHSDLSIEHISERLDFSGSSNFTKAFKQWSGETPSAYRKHNITY